MRTHIKVVAVVNMLFSALGLVGAVIGLVGGVVGGIFSGSMSGFVGGLMGGVIGGVIGGALSLLGLIAAFSLLNYQNWARYFTIVLAVFGLFNFPFGTLFSIYTLWVLLNSETKAIFELTPKITTSSV